KLTRGDRRCIQLDEHLICPHLWHGGVLVAENFGPSTLVCSNCLHRAHGAPHFVARCTYQSNSKETGRGALSGEIGTGSLNESMPLPDGNRRELDRGDPRPYSWTGYV